MLCDLGFVVKLYFLCSACFYRRYNFSCETRLILRLLRYNGFSVFLVRECMGCGWKGVMILFTSVAGGWCVVRVGSRIRKNKRDAYGVKCSRGIGFGRNSREGGRDGGGGGQPNTNLLYRNIKTLNSSHFHSTFPDSEA